MASSRSVAPNEILIDEPARRQASGSVARSSALTKGLRSLTPALEVGSFPDKVGRDASAAVACLANRSALEAEPQNETASAKEIW